MKALLPTLLLTFVLPAVGGAQFLNEFQWKSRPIILFAPNPSDPLFVQQYALLQEAVEELRERRVSLVLVTPEGNYENTSIFLDEAASRRYYDYFGAQPYQLELSLVGLDGNEKFRARNTITPVSVLFELIDRMPMRRRELLQGLGNKSQTDREGDERPGGQRYE